MDFSLTQLIRHSAEGLSLLELLTLFVGAGVVFGTLERCFPANPRERWLLRPGWKLDLFYWFFTPVVTKVITNFVLVFCVGAAYCVVGRNLDKSILDGYGPVGAQPLWLQVVEMLILADLIGYWTHRGFHVTRAWRFHAVHHSPKAMDWLSAYRMHPVNEAVSHTAKVVVLMMIGFAPKAVTIIVPFVVVYVVFLHTNIAVTLGPLRYVVATPTFHRWHHSSEPEASTRTIRPCSRCGICCSARSTCPTASRSATASRTARCPRTSSGRWPTRSSTGRRPRGRR